jgi:hypothetical protein
LATSPAEIGSSGSVNRATIDVVPVALASIKPL